MKYLQDSLISIVNSEHEMVLDAEKRFGPHYLLAADATSILSTFVQKVHRKQRHFSLFLSHAKKHLVLALLSTLRQHQVQATMNIRQALEAGCVAAFALGNPDAQFYPSSEGENVFEYAEKHRATVYRWLDENFRSYSDVIKASKKNINVGTAHANVIFASNVFEETDSEFETPFFDVEDDFSIRAGLFRVADNAIMLLDLIAAVEAETKSGLVFSEEFRPAVKHMIPYLQTMRTELIDSAPSKVSI